MVDNNTSPTLGTKPACNLLNGQRLDNAAARRGAPLGSKLTGEALMKRNLCLAVLAGLVALAATTTITKPAEASFILDVTYTDGSISGLPFRPSVLLTVRRPAGPKW